MTAWQPSVRIAPNVTVLVDVKSTSCRRGLSFGLCEYYISIFDNEASRENLRDEPADLLGREVRDAENLPTHQLPCSVEPGELRAGPLDSDVTEVYQELVGRFLSLWKLLRPGYRPYSDLNSFKVLPRELRHSSRRALWRLKLLDGCPLFIPQLSADTRLPESKFFLGRFEEKLRDGGRPPL